MRKSFALVYSSQIPFVDEVVFNKKREFIATDNLDFEGRSVQGSVIKVDVPSDRYKGLTANDFSLENQLAVGVNLEPVKCSLATSTEMDAQIK